MASEAGGRDEGRIVGDLRVAFGLHDGAWGPRRVEGGTGGAGRRRGGLGKVHGIYIAIFL